MKKISINLMILFLGCLFLPNLSANTNYLTPFSQKIKNVQVRNYSKQSYMKLPLIAWGADIVTIYANGNKVKSVSGSLFKKAGLSYELYREDDFAKQVEQYLKGETVFLRGTMGMINMASDITERDNRTKMVVVYQHSWSAGGDCIVVKQGINSVRDLKGKTIAIQSYGPHVDYFMKLISDAGLSFTDVNVLWTKDLLGPEGDTPMALLYKKNIDAAFVIIPDGLALTSNGTVGTGAEESIKGAKILLSTKTANRIINDVYAVRKDYFTANKSNVENFVHSMLKAQEEVQDLFRNKSGSKYSNLLRASATMLLDSAGATADAEGMYYDAEHAGFNGNVKFFNDSSYLRNFNRLTSEIQDSFISIRLISSKKTIMKADWNWNAKIASGLKYANLKESSRFNVDEVSSVITKKQQQDNLKDALFAFEIYFKPNQNNFTINLYKKDFDRVIELAATYGGAIITIEGHSDPMGYLRKQKKGESQIILKQIAQAAKNLSYSRANSVRDEIITYAKSRNITLDTNQFAVIGYGISKPVYPVPKTEQQWLDNMRVEFRIIQVEAEENVFKPL